MVSEFSPTGDVAFLNGGGELGELTRRLDWSQTPAGPIKAWPQSLRVVLRIMLDSKYAMWVGWGPDLTFFYNDAYARMTLGPKHPWALGKAASEVWSEIWDDVAPRTETVMQTGQATWDESLLLFLEREGFPEETYHTFSYSPIPDDRGRTGGLLCVVTEDTRRTIGERRLSTLRKLASATSEESTSAVSACKSAAETLSSNPQDIPFSLIYLLNHEDTCVLAGTSGVPPGEHYSPESVRIGDPESPWPFQKVLNSGRPVSVSNLVETLGPISGGCWPEPPQTALVLPLEHAGHRQHTAGFLIVGVSPRLVFSDGYQDFFYLVKDHISSAVANARANEAERRRAEALAELDRAKTDFFSNVSHEFRTPAPTILWVTEPDGKHSYLSKQWFVFAGGISKCDLNFGWLDHLHPDDIERTRSVFQDANRKQEPFEVDYRLRDRDGDYRWMVDVGLPRFDDNSRFLGYIGTVTDIDVRKNAEETLRSLAADLSETNRRKTQFLATLGHELRNPLAPIRTGLEVMKLSSHDPAALQETREMMERQVKLMAGLIDDLLDVSRITLGKLQLRKSRILLSWIVRNAVEATRPFINESQHQLSVEIAEEDIYLEADSNRLTQVVANLLTNAAKYTPQNGKIALTADRKGSQAVIAVRDTGIGIPQDQLDEIFEMFAQIKRPTDQIESGLGIGLTLVKSLIEMHDGTVDAQSRGINQGSQFTIRLPILQAKSADQESEVHDSAPQPKHPACRVMVVDDNAAAAKMLSLAVRALGHEVHTAQDGEEAVATAESFRPDVILMDLGMPRMNGFEAAKHIRNQAWGGCILLIAVTGWGHDEDRERSKAAGFDHHLVKPAEPLVIKRLLQARAEALHQQSSSE